MFLIHSFCKKVSQVCFGNTRSKKSSKKRTRTLRIEELEAREMLSATPVDWDWDSWWGNFDSNTVQVDPLPSSYNTDSCSEDFGQITIGGNSSQVGATSPFIPDVVSDLAAYNSVTRQGNAAFQNGSGNSVTGVNTETITVGILSTDLGGGDWTYSEAATYSYNLPSGDDLYWGGYSYYVSSSFIGGVYDSTFFLTTNDHFSINDTTTTATDEASSSITTLISGSVIETVSTTFYHNTITSQQTASETRTTVENTTLSGTGTYSYLVAGSSITGTITQSGSHFADSHVLLSYSGSGNGWDVSGSQSAHITDVSTSGYQGGGNYSGTLSNGNGSSTISGAITEHGSESENLTLTVTGILDGDWSLTGSGTVITSSDDSFINIGSGSYGQTVSEPGNSMSVTGTNSSDITRSNDSSGTIHLSLASGTWIISGGTNESSGQSDNISSYSENGSYLQSSETGSNCGTFTRSGNSNDSSDYTITSTHTSGGWQTTGTGSETGCSQDHSSYTGGGSFTMTLGDPNIVGSNGNNGSANHNGSSEGTATWNADWSIQNGEWIRTSGTGTSTSDECSHSDYNGCVGTTESFTQGDVTYSTTTTRSSNGYEDNQSRTTANLSVVNGEWQTTGGSGTGTGTCHSYQGYLTSGGYSSSSSGVSGTFCSNGHEELDATSNLRFTWDGSEWNTTGTIDYDSCSSQCAQQIGGGTITTSDSTSTRYENFGDNSSSEFHWREQLFADGSQVLVSGSGTNTFGHDQEQITDGTGTFSETTDTGNGGTLVSSGGTTSYQKWTSNGSGSETSTVINNAWELSGGTYSVTDTDYNKVTKNGTGTLSQGNQGGEVTITQWDLTDVTTTIDGSVVGSAGDKEWVYSGDDTYITGGDYSYTETPREAEYSRTITGGEISGTVTETFTTHDGYDSETRSHLDEGSTAWIVVFGSATATAGGKHTQSYEGAGGYEIQSGSLYLTGDVSESGSFSAEATGISIKSTYNTATNEWEEADDSNEGKITYTDTVSFEDSGSGSDGDITINDRTVKYDSTYTETVNLDSGVTDYDLYHHETTSYDVKKIDDAANGTNTKTSAWSSGFTLDADWTSDILEIGGWTGTRTSTYTENHTDSITQDSANATYDTYSHDVSDNSSGTLTETLNHDALFSELSSVYPNSVEDLLFDGCVWIQSSIESDTTQSTSTNYTKSTTTEEMYSTLGGYGFIGTATVDVTSRYSKMLHKNNTNGTITGDGYERKFSSHCDSFVSDNDEEFEIGYGCGYGCGCGCGYGCGYGCGCSYEQGYTGKFNGGYFIGGTGSLSGSHHANSSSDTDLTYTWTDGSWSITGEGTTKKGFGYNWSDTASNEHDTGCTSGSDCGKHEEEATVKWDYNSGVWSISSVEGGGCGTYDYACDWDSCTTYERGFYESTISGTQCAYSNHHRNDSWDVSFKLINGQVVRETEGTSTATIDRGCSFCGNGSYQDSNDTTSTGTYCYYGTGTNTYHSEIEATHCESGSQSYLETITSQWSNKANEQGYLVQNNSADLHITAKADGFYCSYLYNYSCSHYDASYDNSCNYGCGCGCYSYGYYSCGCVHTDSVSEQTTDLSEHYTSTLNEHWHSDGGAFYRISFDGTACGGGLYDAPTSSSSHRDKYDKYGSTSSYGCGCSYSCSSYTDCSSDSCSESWHDVDYDYTASWGWNNDNEISASVSNHVTGDIGGTSSSSWHCEYGYSYGCGCGCTYGCGGCSHYDQPEGDYDETISHTGWKNGQYGPLFTTRWSPFSGSVSEYSYCCTYNYGCGCSYDYSYSCFYGYFSAPNFSSYVSDSTYSGCQYISGSTSHAGNYWWSDSHGSMPASPIPSEGGRYYSGSYDYYGYVYVGSSFSSPVGDSGTTMETPTPIEGGRIPDCNNYTLVNVETYLPPLPEVAIPGSGITEVTNESPCWAGTSAGSFGQQCFVEGTQVVIGAEFTEDNVFIEYVTENIEDIEVGDLVYSYDTVTGEVTQQEVTETFVREADHLNYLTIVDENGNEQVIKTTDSHPFWVVTDDPDLERAASEVVDENGVILYHENLESGLNGYWVEAKDLREGDVFLGANGELSTLVSTERVVFPDGVTVYNFTVEGNHNYFVLAEEGEHTSLLVHNAEYGDDVDETIDVINKQRLQGLSKLGSGLESVANFLNSINPLGSIYEFFWGEDASGKQLPLGQRALAGVSVGGGTVLATAGQVGKILNKVDDAAKALDVANDFGKLRNTLTAVRTGMVGKNANVKNYLDRFDIGNPDNYEIPHVHFAKTGKHNIALNMDGTWKHKPPHNWHMPQKARDYLESLGIKIEPW